MTSATKLLTGDKCVWQGRECIIQAVEPDDIYVVRFSDETTKKVLGTSLVHLTGIPALPESPAAGQPETAPIDQASDRVAIPDPVAPVPASKRSHHKRKPTQAVIDTTASETTLHNPDFPDTNNPTMPHYTHNTIRLALATAVEMELLSDEPIVKAHYKGYRVGFETALTIICGSLGIDLSWMEGHDVN